MTGVPAFRSRSGDDLLVDASSLLLNGTIGQLAVIVVDLQKSVVSWNSGASQLFGVEKMIGRQINDLELVSCL